MVIATKGRVSLVDELLASLDVARSRYDGESEVILVDDSEGDDVEGIRASCVRHDARVVTFGPSVSAKRNRGVSESSHEIVLLLDSDCIATPNLLIEHAAVYADSQVGAVAGLLEFVGPDTWFWNAVNNTPFVVCFGFPRWMKTVPWTPTANCSIRRDVFLKAGGFDSAFPNKPGGEDVDLGLRITQSGWEMRCCPKALVYHQKKTWIPVKSMVKRLWHYGSADCFLMERHPDLCWSCYPRQIVITAVVAILVFLSALVLSNPLLLVALPIYFTCDILFGALAMQRYESHKVSFLQQCVVQLLILDNEFGFAFRCLQRKEFAFLAKQLVYFDGQATGIQERGSLLWSARFFALALTAGFMLVA